MPKHRVLLIEPQKVVANTIIEFLAEYQMTRVVSASEGIIAASDTDFDCVVLELSLGGHSGFEFLYEFRSYADWQEIPIIVYTTVRLSDTVLKSRSWEALSVSEYLYKPTASLHELNAAIGKAVYAQEQTA